MPSIVPVGPVFSSALVVIPDSSYSTLATLASSIHLSWVLRWGSMLKLDIRYSTSDVFDTFPFPGGSQELEAAGRNMEAERHRIMLSRKIGLTALYNLVNDSSLTDAADPDVMRLREIHSEIDQLVIELYGWSDVVLAHGFHTYRQTERWTICPDARTEILDRLLEENHRRAADEEAANSPTGKRTRKRATASNEEGLF